jgi:hypothetical protein
VCLAPVPSEEWLVLDLLVLLAQDVCECGSCEQAWQGQAWKGQVGATVPLYGGIAFSKPLPVFIVGMMLATTTTTKTN